MHKSLQASPSFQPLSGEPNEGIPQGLPFTDGQREGGRGGTGAPRCEEHDQPQRSDLSLPGAGRGREWGSRGIALFLATFILLAAFWPVCLWYARRVLASPAEWYGLAALALAGFVLFSRHAPAPFNPRRLWLTNGLLLGYAGSYEFVPPSLRAALALAALLSLLGVFCRGPALPAGVLGLLGLSLPLISTLDFYLGYPLRVASAIMGAGLLRLASLPVKVAGTVLEYGGQTVWVDAPCSGARMLWAGLLLAFSLAALRGWNGPRTLAAVALAVALVVVANALRTAALFFPAAGLVQVPAWVHPACGVFVFLALTGLLLMLGAFWNRKKPCALP